jgi:F0F1-type ATP synthase delta subunit
MAHVTRKELAEVIGAKTLHHTDKASLVNGLAAYIATEHKIINVDSLLRDVMQYRLEHGYVEAVAVSAHPLPKQVLDDITSLLRQRFPDARHIRVDSVLDETVVGGVRIELPQEVLDLSIRNKLNMFKRLVAEERM